MDEDKFWKNYSETTPEKVRDRDGTNDQALDFYHRYFVDILPQLTGPSRENMRLAAEARVNVLDAEMARRRAEAHSDRHHQQAMSIGRKTLFWAIVAGIGTVALVLLETPLATLLHAKASSQPQELRTMSPVASMPTPSPTPTETPLAPATPAAAAEMPTPTPMKYPPPAP